MTNRMSCDHRPPGSPTNGVTVIDEAQVVQQRHDSVVRIKARGGEPGRLAEVTDEVSVGFLHVRAEGFLRQLMEPPTPDHVVHAAMESQLMALSLHRVQQRNKG